jgi:hypothetical protein
MKKLDSYFKKVNLLPSPRPLLGFPLAPQPSGPAWRLPRPLATPITSGPASLRNLGLSPSGLGPCLPYHLGPCTSFRPLPLLAPQPHASQSPQPRCTPSVPCLPKPLGALPSLAL